MSPAITAMEAQGWQRDITLNGSAWSGSTSYARKRRDHLRAQGFETSRVEIEQSGRQFVVIMKRRAAT